MTKHNQFSEGIFMFRLNCRFQDFRGPYVKCRSILASYSSHNCPVCQTPINWMQIFKCVWTVENNGDRNSMGFLKKIHVRLGKHGFAQSMLFTVNPVPRSSSKQQTKKLLLLNQNFRSKKRSSAKPLLLILYGRHS